MQSTYEKKQRKVSVIIPNFNGEHLLQPCLRSISKQSYGTLEILVIDNSSLDGSIRIIEELFPSVRVIKNNQNLGFASAINQGITSTSSEYIFLLNNDAKADYYCVEQLVDTIEQDDRIGLVTSKMLFPDGRINSTGISVSRSGAAWNRGMFEEDRGQYSLSGPVLGACAGASLYRRSLFVDIGLFDEDFFLLVEDVDLAFRAHCAGWDCWYCATAVVEHINSATIGSNSNISVYYGNRNIIWFVCKSFPTALLLRSLPWIIGRNFGIIIYYILQKKAKSIILAKFHGILGIPKMIRRRKKMIIRRSMDEIIINVHIWADMNMNPTNKNMQPVHHDLPENEVLFRRYY